MIKSIVGPMFAGKSSVLINRYQAIWRKETVRCFKPIIDTRDVNDGDYLIKSRNSNEGIVAIGINTFEDILNYLDDSVNTILIDEAQFIGGNYLVLSEISLVLDIDIYVGGLNMDYEQKPFGYMPQIMAISQEVEFVPAVCYDCNKPAYFVYNDTQTETINVGDSGYVSLCRNCLEKRKIKDNKETELGRSLRKVN